MIMRFFLQSFCIHILYNSRIMIALSCSLGLVVFSESWYIWRSPVHVVTVGLAHLPDECWLLRILHSQHHVQCVDRGQEEVAHALYWGRG